MTILGGTDSPIGQVYVPYDTPRRIRLPGQTTRRNWAPALALWIPSFVMMAGFFAEPLPRFRKDVLAKLHPRWEQVNAK